MSLPLPTLFLLFFIAYTIMLPVTALHVLFNWKVLHCEGYTTVQQLKACGPRVEAYTKTIPWQPLYNLLAFGLLSRLYLGGLSPWALLATGAVWAGMGIVFDALTWVVLPHPWRLTPRELFVGHQPWLSLCYVCIVLGTWGVWLW